MKINARLHGLDARLFPCGLAAAAGRAEFTYYPHVSILSGRMSDRAREREVVRGFILAEQERQGNRGRLEPADLDRLLDDRLETVQVRCELRTLSDVIRDEQVQRIDLLKVDVERSELDVLRGLSGQDWPKVRQLVVEVHDDQGDLAAIVDLLEARGFETAVEQESSLSSTRLSNVYARRPGAAGPPGGAPGPRTSGTRFFSPGVLVDHLRTRVKERLPEYMVPSAFVLLEQLPLTANGKVDRRALPSPDAALAVDEARHVDPRNAEEESLARIWAEVLGRPRVSATANFFDLGGDSILGLLVVSRANRAGLPVTLKQLFQYQTLSDLAAVCGRPSARSVDEVARAGPVPLTPIQGWFFQQELAEPHHFDQAFLVRSRRRVDPAILASALTRVVEHHDALRLRFRSTPAGWVQQLEETVDPVPVSVFEPGGPSPERSGARVREAVARANAGLDLARGPLVRAVVFPGSAGPAGPDPDRILLVAHHLVVDGVSWHILLEDLATACSQLAAGQAVELSPRTASYASWARRLAEVRSSGLDQDEVDHWNVLDRAGEWTVPIDHPGGENTRALADEVTVRLGAEETAALLGAAADGRGAPVNVLLLTALVQALTGWTGQRSVRIDLEGHGRDESLTGLDVTRTVGWFTSLYPAVFALDQRQPAGDRVRSIREQIGRTPGNGVGYGMLRYLDRSTRGPVRSAVLFNYLGRLDGGLAGSSVFAPPLELARPLQSPRQQRQYLLEVDGWMSDGLVVGFTFGRKLHRRATVEALVGAFTAALGELIRGASTAAVERGPRALTSPGVEAPRLARVLRRLRPGRDPGPSPRIESIDPLTPAQQGMLFGSLAAPGAGVHVEQLILTLDGPIDLETLTEAWRRVVARHAALRTAFLWEEEVDPVQVVVDPVDLECRREDWTSLDRETAAARLETLLAADRRHGFDLCRPPPMRIALLSLARDRLWLVWSFHHLAVDGWCLPIVLGEVGELHDALRQGRPARLPPVRPYRDYVSWLSRQDPAGPERFWRRTLEGVDLPTPLG
ncbi:MAG: FkbM family methyltransferase, partial [Candidatus Riflebacteria bacterium]|nr:FkbM family methyltransferase [Candidatus Riflebacteria bacterium]